MTTDYSKLLYSFVIHVSGIYVSTVTRYERLKGGTAEDNDEGEEVYEKEDMPISVRTSDESSCVEAVLDGSP